MSYPRYAPVQTAVPHDKNVLTVKLHPRAPDKPKYGAHCNGCGYCCAAETCPVARIFLLQFHGECRALMWQDDEARYVCGMAVYPDLYLPIIPRQWRVGFGKFFSRYIAAGTGCDFDGNVLADD